MEDRGADSVVLRIKQIESRGHRRKRRHSRWVPFPKKNFQHKRAAIRWAGQAKAITPTKQHPTVHSIACARARAAPGLPCTSP